MLTRCMFGAALLAVLVLPGSLWAQEKGRPPNIVFILTDDMEYYLPIRPKNLKESAKNKGYLSFGDSPHCGQFSAIAEN